MQSYTHSVTQTCPVPPELREKSKKYAEQAAAVVCLRVLGLPEGRVGEENQGLVGKRKRERMRSPPDQDAAEEPGGRKRHLSLPLQPQVSKGSAAVVTNGARLQSDGP